MCLIPTQTTKDFRFNDYKHLSGDLWYNKVTNTLHFLRDGKFVDCYVWGDNDFVIGYYPEDVD